MRLIIAGLMFTVSGPSKNQNIGTMRFTGTINPSIRMDISGGPDVYHARVSGYIEDSAVFLVVGSEPVFYVDMMDRISAVANGMAFRLPDGGRALALIDPRPGQNPPPMPLLEGAIKSRRRESSGVLPLDY